MLSLSPRYDLFKFNLPKDFLPKEIEEKYRKILNKDPNVIVNPIDYLNESIQAITFPGIKELVVEQQQISHRLGKIEPTKQNYSTSTVNPLAQLDSEFTVTFRMNQGLYNYFMLFETIFHKTLKYQKTTTDDVFFIEILSETGSIMGRIKLFQPQIDGIDGLEFGYNKIERTSETFNMTFKFNNIDFDIV